MVLIHDDDLAELHGIYGGTVSRSNYINIFSSSQSIESLQPDAMLSHLRSAQLKIHEVPFGLGKRLLQYYPNFSLSHGGARTREVCRLLTMARVPMEKLFG